MDVYGSPICIVFACAVAPEAVDFLTDHYCCMVDALGTSLQMAGPAQHTGIKEMKNNLIILMQRSAHLWGYADVPMHFLQ